MKRILTALFLLVILAIPVSAEQVPAYVFDHAMLMTQGEQMDLDFTLQDLRDTYGLNMAILTANTLYGKSPQQYADDYYDQIFGVDTDGILFLLSMEDRDWYISTSGKAMELLTDGETYDSVEDIIGHFSDGDYYDGFRAWAAGLPWYLENEEPEPSPSFLLALAIGAGVAGITVFAMYSAMNTKRAQHSASHYLTEGSYHLRTCQDFFLYRRVTKTAKPKENSSGRSGGGGGRSHGGGGGKF